ncbi:MAG: type II toxin-antitoxin system prevent-host-death family antitoxin [Azoarcus sp.]|nr:type II toxin-antitoxin system prevent-host-death family antitoxin [Azoarcus sp.]
MQTVNIAEVKAHLSALLDAVEAGEEVIITRRASRGAACPAVTHRQASPRQKRGPQARGNPEGGSDCIGAPGN